MRRTTLGTTVTAVMAVMAVLVLAGCGGGADEGSDSSGGSVEAPAEAAGDGQAADDAGDEAAPQVEGGVLTEVARTLTGREIIYTVDLTISTDDVPAAAGQAAGIAVAAGGFVASENVNGDHDATLTLQVPSAGHQDTVTELETLGKVTNRSRGTEDVTQEVVDTASRIESQRASIARIRTLLAEANQLTEVVSIESELARREADLDALLSRQEQLAGLTSMATVTLNLYASGDEPPDEEDDDSGFLAGLAGGWDAFLTVGGGALTVLGAVLPFAVVAAVVAVPVYLVIRRRRGQPAAPVPDIPVA